MEPVREPRTSGARHERKKQVKSETKPAAQTGAQAGTSTLQSVDDGGKKKSQRGGKNKRKNKNRQSSDGGSVAGVGPQTEFTTSQVPVSTGTLKDEIVETDKSVVQIELSTSDELPIQTELSTIDVKIEDKQIQAELLTIDMKADELSIQTQLSTTDKADQLAIQTELSTIELKTDELPIQTELSTIDKTTGKTDELALKSELSTIDVEVDEQQIKSDLSTIELKTDELPIQTELATTDKANELPIQSELSTIDVKIEEQPIQAELLTIDMKADELSIQTQLSTTDKADQLAIQTELSTIELKTDELPIQTELSTIDETTDKTTDKTDELALKSELSTIDVKIDEHPIKSDLSTIELKTDKLPIQTELSTTDETTDKIDELALQTELLKTDLIEKEQETEPLKIEIVETDKLPLQIESSKIDVEEQPPGEKETLEIAMDKISQPPLQAELLKVEGDKKGEQLLEQVELLSRPKADFKGKQSKKALSDIFPNGVETSKRLSPQTELLKNMAASSGRSLPDAKASAKDVHAAINDVGNSQQGPRKKNKKRKGKNTFLDEGKSTPVVQADSLQYGVALEQLSQEDDPSARTVEANEQPPARPDLLNGTVAKEQQTPVTLEAASGGTAEFPEVRSALELNKTGEIKSDLACGDLHVDMSTAECQAREAIDIADQLGSVAVGTDQVECATAPIPAATPAIGESIESAYQIQCAINHVPTIPAIGESIESAVNRIECAINHVPAMPVIIDSNEGANKIECAINHVSATPVIAEGSKGAVPKEFPGKRAGMNKKPKASNKKSLRSVTETVYVVYADERPCMIFEGDIKNVPKTGVPVEINKVPKKDVNTKQITILKREVPIVTKQVASTGEDHPVAVPPASPRDSVGPQQPTLKMLSPTTVGIADQAKETVTGNDVPQDLLQDSSGPQHPKSKVPSSAADNVTEEVPKTDHDVPQDAAGLQENSLQVSPLEAEDVTKDAQQTGDNLPQDSAGSVLPATAEGISEQVPTTDGCLQQSPSALQQLDLKVAPTAEEGVVQHAPGTSKNLPPQEAAAPQHMSFNMPPPAAEGVTWDSLRPSVNRGVGLDEEGVKAIACFLHTKLYPSYMRGSLTGEIEMCLHALSDYPSLSDTTRKYFTRKAVHIYLMFAKDLPFANRYIDYKDWVNGVKPLGTPRVPRYGYNSDNRNRQNSYSGGNNYNRTRGYPRSDSPFSGCPSYSPFTPPPPLPVNMNSFSPVGRGMIGCHVPPPGTFPERSPRFYPHDGYFNRNQLGNVGSKGYHIKEKRWRDGRGDGGKARGPPGNEQARGYDGSGSQFHSAGLGPGGDMATVVSGAVGNSADVSGAVGNSAYVSDAVRNAAGGSGAVGNGGVGFIVSDGNAACGMAAAGNAYGGNAAVGIVPAIGNAAYGNGAGVTAVYGNGAGVTAVYGNVTYGNAAVGAAAYGNGAVGNGAVGNASDINAASGVGYIKECIQQHDSTVTRL